MMSYMYVLAVWAHIFVVTFWVGAMFFSDPESTRFFSRQVERIGGVGWYAQAILWTTGFFMLFYREISLSDLFSAELLSTPWGKMLWLKIILVLALLGLQIVVGHKPSNKAPFAYVLLAFFVIGISVVLVRPVIF